MKILKLKLPLREKPRFDAEAEKFFDDMEANMKTHVLPVRIVTIESIIEMTMVHNSLPSLTLPPLPTAAPPADAFTG